MTGCGLIFFPFRGSKGDSEIDNFPFGEVNAYSVDPKTINYLYNPVILIKYNNHEEPVIAVCLFVVCCAA